MNDKSANVKNLTAFTILVTKIQVIRNLLKDKKIDLNTALVLLTQQETNFKKAISDVRI